MTIKGLGEYFWLNGWEQNKWEQNEWEQNEWLKPDSTAIVDHVNAEQLRILEEKKHTARVQHITDLDTFAALSID